MAKRYTMEPSTYQVGVWDIRDEGHMMASCGVHANAKRIVDALNAVAALKAAVWGPEGVPAWLEGSDK